MDWLSKIARPALPLEPQRGYTINVLNCLTSYWHRGKYRDKSFLYYDLMCRDFFAYMASQDTDQEYWRAPGSSQRVKKRTLPEQGQMLLQHRDSGDHARNRGPETGVVCQAEMAQDLWHIISRLNRPWTPETRSIARCASVTVALFTLIKHTKSVLTSFLSASDESRCGKLCSRRSRSGLPCRDLRRRAYRYHDRCRRLHVSTSLNVQRH